MNECRRNAHFRLVWQLKSFLWRNFARQQVGPQRELHQHLKTQSTGLSEPFGPARSIPGAKPSSWLTPTSTSATVATLWPRAKGRSNQGSALIGICVE